MKATVLPLRINKRKGVSYWIQSRLTAVRFNDDNILIPLCNNGRFEKLKQILA